MSLSILLVSDVLLSEVTDFAAQIKLHQFQNDPIIQ